MDGAVPLADRGDRGVGPAAQRDDLGEDRHRDLTGGVGADVEPDRRVQGTQRLLGDVVREQPLAAPRLGLARPIAPTYAVPAASAALIAGASSPSWWLVTTTASVDASAPVTSSRSVDTVADQPRAPAIGNSASETGPSPTISIRTSSLMPTSEPPLVSVSRAASAGVVHLLQGVDRGVDPLERGPSAAAPGRASSAATGAGCRRASTGS